MRVLSQAMSSVLPAAVGVALSPIPIVAVILMLGTPRRASNGPDVRHRLGRSGLVAVSVVVLVVSGGADDPNSTAPTPPTGSGRPRGSLFFTMALRQWRKRPKHGEQPELPKWMQSVDKFTPVRALALGVGLSAINPKNLALTLAAVGRDRAGRALRRRRRDRGRDLRGDRLGDRRRRRCSSTCSGASRAEKPLASMREFMAQHNAVIMMVILLVLGAKLIGEGWAGLG